MPASSPKSIRPAAPMLGDQSADPDVERLLEGVAFLTGLMRQKTRRRTAGNRPGTDGRNPAALSAADSGCLHSGFLHPKPSLLESIKGAGRNLPAVPWAVEDADCTFQTCFDLEVHPLTLLSAEFLQTGWRVRTDSAEPGVEKGQALSQWRPTRLSLFLAGSYVHSSDLFMLLTRGHRTHPDRPLGRGRCLHLVCAVPEARRVSSRATACFPYPTRAFTGYRPASGVLSAATEISFPGPGRLGAVDQPGRGSAFSISSLNCLPPRHRRRPSPRINSFFFATPAVNLFSRGSRSHPSRPPAGESARAAARRAQGQHADLQCGPGGRVCGGLGGEKKHMPPCPCSAGKKQPGTCFQDRSWRVAGPRPAGGFF